MGQRLLLVDSDRSFLKEHQVSLEAAFDLDVCSSPEGVLPRLERGGYAAALICVEMADNKGYALCSAIRKSPLLADLKVALISAKATEEEYRRHQSLKGRADLYLHKPVAPSALVSLLTPLVPVKALDPDNPLGELVDTELGDDWLEGLRASIEEPPAPPQRRALDLLPPLPPEAAVTQQLDLRATAAADTSRMRLLEDQVAALHEELRARDQKLATTSADLQQLQRQLSSVTLNLDEMERRNRDAEALREKLAEAEAALQRLEEAGSRDGDTLKTQLREALTERTDLLHQVEALNLQLGEKTQRTIELLKERDRLQLQALELDAFRGRAEELEIALQGRERKLAEFQEAHAQLEDSHNQLQATHAQLEEDQAQLNESLEGLATRHHELEGLHQAALLDAAGHKEHAHNLQMELAGLEATLRGQGRDLAALNDRLRAEEETNLGLQASLAECQRALEARDEEVRRLEANLLTETQRASELQQRYDESTVQHEGERLELMNGLDQKESELVRLAQMLASEQEALASQQQAQAALEADRQSLEAQLAESRERSGRLESHVQEAMDLLRRGSDLARG